MPAQLIVKCPEHLAAVRTFADVTGQRDQLEAQLTRLTEYLRDEWEIQLYSDFAPMSFFWVQQHTLTQQRGMIGGLIYHGQLDNFGDGRGPTFSVCLTPISGWSIHT